MRIIDTGITKEILTGDNFPQLKIAGKLYTVDNRQSTFDKIQNAQTDETLSETEKTKKIYELALGEKEAAEILALDLPVDKGIYLTYCVMGAITGEKPEDLQKIAASNRGKN